jgi:hypothetical protein
MGMMAAHLWSVAPPQVIVQRLSQPLLPRRRDARMLLRDCAAKGRRRLSKLLSSRRKFVSVRGQEGWTGWGKLGKFGKVLRNLKSE